MEVYAEEGGGYIHLRKVILHSGTSGASIWDGDLGAVSYNVGKLEGIHVGFLRKLAGKK